MQLLHRLPPEKSRDIWQALPQIFRPLIRLCFRLGLTVRDLEEVMRQCAVEAARLEGEIDGKQPNVSRIALLTGMSRAEVTRRIHQPTDHKLGEAPQDKIVRAWTTDPEWLTAKGKPKVLPQTGESSFQSLCAAHTTAVTHQTVLDDFLYSGSVEVTPANKVRFLNAGYVPPDTLERAQTGFFSLGQLANTIMHNLSGSADAECSSVRYQESYWSRDVPLSQLEPLERKLTTVLRTAQQKAADRIDQAQEAYSVQRATVGVGVFYFEDANDRADG